MKKFFILSVLIGAFAVLGTSCKNQDIDFPDFDYTTVYFAYQYPVRTIVLGEDVYDTSLDNEHRFEIYAAMGGAYANNKRIDIDFVVDDALCDNLYYADNLPVKPMPSNYYTLASGAITLDRALRGSVGVQLTDAFFADPASLQNTYVVPLRMTGVANADSILSGTPKTANPVRTNATDWDINLPKDYVLYCVKYINQWHANYLRRGVDVITQNGASSTNVRHAQYVENNPIAALSTLSLTSVEFPVAVTDAAGANQTCALILTFDAQGKCAVSTVTPGFTVSGSGSFEKKGEKNSWGNKDRDALYLDYTVSMTGKTYATKDTLVVRDRGVSIETFTPVYNAN